MRSDARTVIPVLADALFVAALLAQSPFPGP
jgi:hypothetical protein